MKNYVIILLLCIFSSNSYAQEVSYSKAIKLTNKTPKFKILGRNAKYFIAERWGEKFHYLDLYSSNLRKISTKEFKIEADEALKKIWIQPKQGWMLYTKSVKDFTYINARQMDVNLNVKTTPLVLDSILERKDYVQNNFRTTQSLNEKYLAIYLPIFSKGSLDYFLVSVYDENMNQIQKLKLNTDFVKQGTFVELLVLNNGAVAAVFLEKNSNNKFEIYFSDEETKFKTFTLNLDNQVFKKLKFEVDNLNNTLLIAGLNLYQDNKRLVAADAFFTLKMNLETGEISNKTVEVFTNEFYKLLTENDSKTEKVFLQTFYIKTILPRVDGGFLVFAESYYENEEVFEVPQSNGLSGGGTSMMIGQTSFSPSTYKTNYYFYNDVIVYTLDKDLKIESVNIIKKRQKSQEDNGGYSSFNIVNQQNMLEVLFLDEISTNSSLKRYTLNKDSEIFKDYILNVGQNDVMPVVKLAVQTAPNEILVPSYLNNSFSIIKIIFEDNK